MMKEPEQKVTEEEPRKLSKFLKKVRMKGLMTGILIVATFWLGWTSYQKLFIVTITLPANQIIIEDLAMRTDGRLQFSIKDKNGLPLNWIVGGGIEDDGVYSYQVGRTLLEGPLSIDYGIGEKNIFDVEGFSKIIYEDDQGNELVIWEEGMELPIVEVPIMEEIDSYPDSWDRRD